MADERPENTDKTPGDGAPVPAPARAKRPAALGRGLSALLGDLQADAPVAAGQAPSRDGLSRLPVSELHPHPEQPRRRFDEGALDELAESIRTRGLVQPILVRPAPSGGGWQIVAGERRWRAAQRAGLHDVPVLVRDLDDSETFTIALIENIQRQDLTAIEEAEAYARLRDRLGHSPDAIGRMTGKSRSHVANILRLLDLPDDVRALVADGRLGMGHARALIGHTEASALARQTVAKGWSVRKVEAMVRKGSATARATAAQPRATTLPGAAPDADIAALESHLSAMLGIAVAIDHQGDSGGSIRLAYSSLDQLDMLCQKLSGGQF